LLEAPLDETAGKLSAREREVLAWVAAGRRQADIAATLGLSGRTVENHLRSARRHLGVATTAQAIKIAIRKGEIKVLHGLPGNIETRTPIWLMMFVRANTSNKPAFLCAILILSFLFGRAFLSLRSSLRVMPSRST
jgi:DNA-binding CsgD family transcriptional regulator